MEDAGSGEDARETPAMKLSGREQERAELDGGRAEEQQETDRKTV